MAVLRDPPGTEYRLQLTGKIPFCRFPVNGSGEYLNVTYTEEQQLSHVSLKLYLEQRATQWL